MFCPHRRKRHDFRRLFRSTCGVATPQALVTGASPFANVYAAGYRELQSQIGGVSSNPHPPKLKSLSAATVSMELASAEEGRRAAKGMPWLAPTAPVTPFHRLVGSRCGHDGPFSRIVRDDAAHLP